MGRPSKQKSPDKSVRTFQGYGNSRECLLERIARDAPYVFLRYVAGELPSVHAAAVAAGLVKARTTQVP